MTAPFRRGEIRLANLSPRFGTEPGKTRPVLIVQNQALLDAGHPSTIIIPLTTNTVESAEPLRFRVEARGKLRQDSDLLTDQVRAIDNRRLGGHALATLDETMMVKVDGAVKEVMGVEPE